MRDLASIKSLGEFRVLKSSAAYHDIHRRVANFNLPADTVGANVSAWSPVCRVYRHSEGDKHLALILALPALLDACRAALYLMGDDADRETIQKPDGPLGVFSVPHMLRNAIAKAEGTDHAVL